MRFRSRIVTLSVAAVVSFGMSSITPAVAAKTDCVNNTCVWDQPDYNGRLVVVTKKCLDFPVRSGANTRTSGNSKLSLYQQPGCHGFSIPLSHGYSTPDIHMASAKVD